MWISQLQFIEIISECNISILFVENAFSLHLNVLQSFVISVNNLM